MREDQKRIIKRVIQVGFSCFVAFAIIGALIFVTQGRDIPILQPKGTIATQEFNLIMITVGLGLIVVIPVFILLFGIAWKYRASNTKAVYQPDFGGHRGLEALWWTIPCLIILVLAIITAISTYALDPYKKLESDVPPVKIQVVAMEWKWLFIYPDEGIATVNYVNIPEDTPVEFTITSDAPMNSFWVPALGGQVYAMSGMSTQLSLMADAPGTFNGSSANISGDGFASMRFKVNAMTPADFRAWQQKSIYSTNLLDSTTYKDLAVPSKNDAEKTYALMDTGLYNDIIMKYMMPEGEHDADEHDHTTHTHSDETSEVTH